MTALRATCANSAQVQRNSTADTNRRADMGMVTMKFSTARAVANVAAGANVAASRLPLQDRDAAERFSAKVIPFSAADLAKAAHRTKSAAKGWKDASRAPSLASTINMARALPSVSVWLAEEIGLAMDARSLSADAVIRWAMDNRAADDLPGQLARAIIRELAAAPEKKPPA